MGTPVLTAPANRTDRILPQGTYEPLERDFNTADSEGDPILYYEVMIWSDRKSPTGDLQISGASQSWYNYVKVTPDQLSRVKYYSGNTGAKNQISIRATDKDGASNTLTLNFTQSAPSSNKQPTLTASTYPSRPALSPALEVNLGGNLKYSDPENNAALEYRINKTSSTGQFIDKTTGLIYAQGKTIVLTPSMAQQTVFKWGRSDGVSGNQATLETSAIDSFGNSTQTPSTVTWSNLTDLASQRASDFKKDSDTLSGDVRFWTNKKKLDPSLPTFMYAHGWCDSASSGKSQYLFSALSRKYGDKVNIVLIDWKGLAADTNPLGVPGYPRREAQVTQKVGELVAKSIAEAGLDTSKLTLLGHSLGSFVVAHAANTIATKYKLQKPQELIAFDPAFCPTGSYDTAGDLPGTQSPLSFKGLAAKTTSFTVSDGMGPVDSTAGDNPLAATADSAYLVEFAPDGPAGPLDANQVATAYHGATVNAYAQLLLKDSLTPQNVGLNCADRYDASGQWVGGAFDGVVASSPNWTSAASITTDREIFAAPAFGWIDRSSPAAPVVNGTSKNDVMTSVVDGILGWAKSTTLKGNDGSDILAPCPNNATGGNVNAIDSLIGGPGSDQFWIGQIRFGKYYEQYTDNGSYGSNSYAVLWDFDPSADKIMFGRPRNSVFWTDGKTLDPATKKAPIIPPGVISSAAGRPGVAVYSSTSDLICYIPGMTQSGFDAAVSGGSVQFGAKNDLDSAMLISSPTAKWDALFPVSFSI